MAINKLRKRMAALGAVLGVALPFAVGVAPAHAQAQLTITKTHSGSRIVEEFLAAATSGRTDRLVALLTDDVTAVSDGAGLARRLLRYTTRERVASLARAGFRPTPAKRRPAGGSLAMPIARVNGSLAVLAVLGDRVVGAVVFEVSDGRVASLCGIAAADRLTRLAGAWRRCEPGAPVIDAW